MKEKIFQHPLKFWAIRIRMETDELWCDIYNIFSLFEECRSVDITDYFKGDFLIKRAGDNTYILYNHNQMLFIPTKKDYWDIWAKYIIFLFI